MSTSSITSDQQTIWREGDLLQQAKPVDPESVANAIYRPDILAAIEQEIESLNGELRTLSLDIHDHPELAFEEHHAHDVLTSFMENHGFSVEKHFHLATAWKATFSNGPGRTVGVNSEMDALKGIGHACGHNLIAISGVAVACALKKVIKDFNIPGSVCLLGTPAEEGSSGKVVLLDHGAYIGMDICLMCHPAPGPVGSISLSSSLALNRLKVEFFGHTAHAALSPWEGTNALDAAVLAYNNISALRQQLRPTHRVHGIIEGKDWAPNIIPDYSRMICYIRTPTRAELEPTVKRVIPCFEAAGLATGCKVKVEIVGASWDLRQNKSLGEEMSRITKAKYGDVDYEWGISSASTDFGHVTYALPSIHPGFSIPTAPNGGNHTPFFERAAASAEAHEACLAISKALAGVGVRVLLDEGFMEDVRRTFEEDQRKAK